MKFKSVVSVLIMMMVLMSCGPGQKKSAGGDKGSENHFESLFGNRSESPYSRNLNLDLLRYISFKINS